MRFKIKKLTLKYAYLSLEKEEIEEICSSVEGEMRSYLDEHYPEHYQAYFGSQTKNQIEDDLHKESSPAPKIKNKDLKTIYRKIASKIHPDKDKGDGDLFSKAAKAYSESDIGKLLEIAGTIGVEIQELSQETIILLDKNIDDLEKEIKSKKQTSAWMWAQAKSNSEKDEIIQYILNNKGDIQ
mgnify:CR=1 FL=1